MPATASLRPPRPADRGITEPLSAERHRIQFSAGSELRAKLERARDLMSHANPSGDFAPIFERALDLLIADLEKKRFGKTGKPSRRARLAKPERITNQTRREVAERDDTSCTFVDDKGRRCGARVSRHVHRGAFALAALARVSITPRPTSHNDHAMCDSD